jgi:hypothetical protein
MQVLGTVRYRTVRTKYMYGTAVPYGNIPYGTIPYPSVQYASTTNLLTVRKCVKNVQCNPCITRVNRYGTLQYRYGTVPYGTVLGHFKTILTNRTYFNVFGTVYHNLYDHMSL